MEQEIGRFTIEAIDHRRAVRAAGAAGSPSGDH